MDKETFITMLPEQPVEKVNRLLQEYDLQEVAEQFGIPTSSFSNLCGKETISIIKQIKDFILLFIAKERE